MNTTVRLCINERKLVRNLEFAFSNFSTFLAELIQNGRRAGATLIEISSDGTELVIRDNGRGIDDFRTLFSIGDSGWDSATQTREHPFGMGFTSALFACGSLCIVSSGRMCQASTAHILDGQPVEITPTRWETGTRITLRDLTFETTRLETVVREIATGFPVPLTLNGTTLPRAEALDALPFVNSAVGQVYIRPLDHDHLDISRMRLYLQGIRVVSPRPDVQPDIIVHLDSTMFRARLPDRTTLLDEAQCLQEIEDEVRDVIAHRLELRRIHVDPATFVLQNWNTAMRYAPHLLRDLPCVPARLLAPLDELLCHAEWHYPAGFMYGPPGKVVWRGAVESGEIRVVRGSPYVDLELDSLSAARRAYVIANRGYVCQTQLPEGHWLESAPRLDGDLDVALRVEGTTASAGTGDYGNVQLEVVTCDAVTLQGPWGDVPVESMEIAVGLPSPVVEGRLDHTQQIVLYSPRQCPSPGFGLQQFEAFTGGLDELDEGYREEECGMWRRRIYQARHVGPVDLLNDLLSGFIVDAASAHGATYLMSVDERGHLLVLRKVDPQTAG